MWIVVGARPQDERAFINSGENEGSISRRHSLVEVVRHFRDARFRPLVLRAYSYRCCLTGVAFRLVDAAHIVPVSEPTSTDEPRNGIALNPLLHRAYDIGILGLLPGGRTALNKRLINDLAKKKLDAGLDLVQNTIPTAMTMPTSQEFIPPDPYLLKGLKVRVWTDEDIAKAG